MSSAADQTFFSAVCLVPQVAIVMFFESTPRKNMIRKILDKIKIRSEMSLLQTVF